MTNTRCALALLCACTVVLAGCGSVPPEHFYTLVGNADVLKGNRATPGTPGIAVASIALVTLPESVDRFELVIRTSANRVTVMENERWVESLKSAIPRVIAGDVSQLLGGAIVAVQSDNSSRDAKYRVSIDVVRFDSMLNDAAIIEAFWSVRLAADDMPKWEKSTIRIPVHGGGFDELAAAHALALAGLSGEIAAKIKTLETSGN
jgi:uncharacterized lipoprotein YmbA